MKLLHVRDIVRGIHVGFELQYVRQWPYSTVIRRMKVEDMATLEKR